MASAGRVGRGRRAGGGGGGGESRTRHCTWGCLDPPTPSPKGPSSEILPAGIGAIIRTLHGFDRCFV